MANKTIRCISPIDGSVYAERTALSFAEAQKIVETSAKAQIDWAGLPLSRRREAVLEAVRLLGKADDIVVPELARMMGRPIRYGGEFSGVKERAEYMATIAEKSLTPSIIEESPAFKRQIVREPRGVVFVIAPWNYPYMTAINTIAPALIAGNTVVLKHATQTLLAGERLQSAFEAAGIPQEIFSNLFLDHETTSALIATGKFGFVNFTGSVSAGRSIEKAAGGTFTDTGLELGGKDPAYVAEDADPEVAAASLIDGAMFNSGQCCCGIERIYVHENLYDRFLEKAVEMTQLYILGNPLEHSTTLGPMAHVRFAEHAREQIREAISSGAEALIDPKKFADDGGAYLAPQILIKVDHRMSVMKEETFGPVVGIMKVRNDAEAVELMNDSDYGLTASLWTNDAQKAENLGRQINTGTVFMNRCDYLDPALCWTGRKDTGKGGSLSSIGYQNLTQPKSYHLKKR